MNIVEIINKISPLQNSYKEAITRNNPQEALKIMWDIGDILNNYCKKYNIAPHNLYREIYGKSEGKKNIEQKSYIPREFQSRSYRIRNIFGSKREIDLILYNLKSTKAFLEAMPFFDNPKYKLYGRDP